ARHRMGVLTGTGACPPYSSTPTRTFGSTQEEKSTASNRETTVWPDIAQPGQRKTSLSMLGSAERSVAAGGRDHERRRNSAFVAWNVEGDQRVTCLES